MSGFVRALTEVEQYSLAALMSGSIASLILIGDRIGLGRIAFTSWTLPMNTILYGVLGMLALGEIKILHGLEGLCAADWFGGYIPTFAKQPLCSNLDAKFKAIVEVILAIAVISLLAKFGDFLVKKVNSYSPLVLRALADIWMATLGRLSVLYIRDIDEKIRKAACRVQQVLDDEDIDYISLLPRLEKQTAAWFDTELEKLKLSLTIRNCIIAQFRNDRQSVVEEMREVLTTLLSQRSESTVERALKQLTLET